MRDLAAMLLVLVAAIGSVGAEAPRVRFVEFEASVNPVTAWRIVKAIDEAEAAGEDAVLIRLDTPGGLVDSMETILKRMLASEVPVVVWVGPAGAHAASAGFFVLIAADLAAMAPGTRTGAASTVILGGENREDDVLLKKANQDLAALIRSIAARRSRNVAASEEAVFAAASYEETVALEKGLIDVIAPDVETLLAQIDGRTVTHFDGTEVVLRTAGAELVRTEFSLQHEFREFLAIPAVAYLLLMGGLLGLYVEFTHPGVVFPGVAGALCLLLFAVAATSLPVSTIGILLILLALVMWLLEIKVASYGMLTLGGIVALLVGSLMLIDGPIPELRVRAGLVVPVTLAVAALCIFAVRLAVSAQRARVGTGVEGLVGESGEVVLDLAPEGKVAVHGEIWNASCPGGPLPRGTRVRVVSVDEMWLRVEPSAGRASGRE